MLVGVLGAGQLGRMLALAGYPLGMEFRFLDPASGAPAGQVGQHIIAEYGDQQALAAFLDGLDVATFEFENVPVGAAQWLAERVPFYPPPRALEVGQDRLAEKTLFKQVGLEVHPFLPADSAAALGAAVQSIGAPVVVKTRRGGYDGKGQAVLQSQPDARGIEEVWTRLGGMPLIVEKFVPFERELSVLAARSTTGETVVYPLIQNKHAGGILRHSQAPAPNVSQELQERAEGYARAVMNELGYAGVLAIEFFEVGGKLLANEMAPRVHNSGHWTIEGAATSQFENHLRAIAGLPLGNANAVAHSHMLNLIGGTPEASSVLAIKDAHLHLYGKSGRPGRKIGHITVAAQDPDQANSAAAAVRALIAPSQR
jgi:5-(carboxyamino)imidazole ribonucleotide synthase